jgi:glycosyltransferase involved in cell wall biosynthesis
VTILHVASGRLYGGIERLLVTLAESRGLLKAIDFEFAVCAEGRLSRELQERGARVHLLGEVRLSRPVSIWRARRLLRTVIRTTRPAAMVCHAPWSYAIVGDVARSSGVGPVLWQHDRATGEGFVERRARAIPADLVICNSHWTAGSTDALQPHTPRRVIYCAVPAADRATDEARRATRTSLGASVSDVVILAASRMERWKGQLELLRAVAGLTSRPWVLWIAGGAQRPHERRYAAELEAEARRLGVRDRVHLLGERHDVGALLSASDLLAQANLTPEPFGIIFAEALLAGVPVVTRNMGGAPEIVDDSCGRLVAPGDEAGLRASLDELAGDAALRATLGAAGAVHAAARCAPAVVLPLLERALLSVCVPAAA